MNHKQARELFPGYVLGALEVREQEDLLEHLQSCSDCYQLAQEAMDLGGMLASTIAQADPPVGLKDRVRASLAAPTPNNDVNSTDQ